MFDYQKISIKTFFLNNVENEKSFEMVFNSLQKTFCKLLNTFFTKFLCL